MAWILHIDLRPEVAEYNDNKITIKQLAEKVAIRLLTSQWDKLAAYPDTLRDHIAYLRDSQTEADYVWRWSPLYDVADEDRVLITTGD